MPNKNILIVGGAGFIGNALADGLSSSGHKVLVGDTSARLEHYAIPIPNVEYLEFDWQDLATYPNFVGVDVVIHLAWASNPLSSMSNIQQDAQLNILGTIQLLESFAVNSLEKFVFMSSGGTVYGDSDIQPVKESVQPEPISAYGVSKLACEKYVNIYAAMKKFTPCTLRLGNPYGVYQLQGTPIGAIANFVKLALENQQIEIRGSGEAVRDYIHVADMTAYVDRVSFTEDVVGTYNIASGEGTSLTKILKIIQNITGKPLNVDYTEAPSSDVRAVVLDSTKISEAVGYKPVIGIEDGIKQLIDTYRSTSTLISSNTMMTGTRS